MFSLMFGMGLSLTLGDFRRIALAPVSTLLGTRNNRTNLAQHPSTLCTPLRAIKQKVADGLVATMTRTIGRRRPSKTLTVYANWCMA